MKVKYEDHYSEDYFYPNFKMYTDEYGVERKYYGPSKDWEGFAFMAKFINTEIPEVKSIHDIGCSAGSFVHHSIAQGFDSDGVDISDYAIGSCVDGARGKVRKVDITKSNPLFIKDMAVAFDLLEHIYEKDLDAAMKYIVNSIKPGGYFFACIATARAENEVWSHTSCEDPVPPDRTWLAISGHVHVKNFEYWINKLESKGFRTMYDKMVKFQLFKDYHGLSGLESWSIRNVYIGKKS